MGKVNEIQVVPAFQKFTSCHFYEKLTLVLVLENWRKFKDFHFYKTRLLPFCFTPFQLTKPSLKHSIFRCGERTVMVFYILHQEKQIILIHERWEANRLSTVNVPAYCLERVTRLWNKRNNLNKYQGLSS